MSKEHILPQQLYDRFYLDNHFTPEILSSFRVCLFPLQSTPISLFVNLVDQLKQKHKYITYGGKKIPIVYYTSTAYQIAELKQYFNSITRTEEDNISVKQVPCLQVSPSEANLAIQELNKYISGIEVVKQANDTYYQFARVKLHHSEQNMNLTTDSRVINSIGLDLQYLTLEDLAAGDLFPNIVNMHGYIAVGAINEDPDLEEITSNMQFEKEHNQFQICMNNSGGKQNFTQNAQISQFNASEIEYSVTSDKNEPNIQQNKQWQQQINKKRSKVQFAENDQTSSGKISLQSNNDDDKSNICDISKQSSCIANTETIGIVSDVLSECNQKEVSVAQIRKKLKQKEKSQDQSHLEQSQCSSIYNGILDKRIAELQREFLGILDVGTDPGKLGRGYVRLAVVDARHGEINEDPRADWPSDWPVGLDRFGLINPSITAACTVLYGLLETRWPAEAAAALRSVEMHPTFDPQSSEEVINTIMQQLPLIYQQQNMYSYTTQQVHFSKRHSHKMTFFEATRAGFHFRDYFYPLHIYKKVGLQFMMNPLGNYQLKVRNNCQISYDETSEKFMKPLITSLDIAQTEASAAQFPKGIPYDITANKMIDIQLQQNNEIFQPKTHNHELIYPYTKCVPNILRKMRVIYQIAIDSVLFGFNQKAIEIFNCVYHNVHKLDPSLAFLSLFFKHILKQVINPWKVYRGVDYLIIEGFLGIAFNVLSCTQYVLRNPCQQLAFKVLEFQKLQQFNFLTQNNVFQFFLLYNKLVNQQNQVSLNSLSMKQGKNQDKDLQNKTSQCKDISHFLTSFKLIGVYQLFNKPMINKHETTLLQMLIYNLNIIQCTPRDFIDFLVKDMNANLFYQFQQTQLFSVFINNKTLIEHGFYMQVFEKPSDQAQNLKHVIQSNDHEDMNMNMNLSTQLNYVCQKLQELQNQDSSKEYLSKRGKSRQHIKLKSNTTAQTSTYKSSIHDIVSPTITGDVKLNQQQYGLIQQETKKYCIPIQILQPSTSGVEGQFECLKYQFNDIKCRLELTQKVKNEWNNVKAIIAPQACRLQSQINQFKKKEINQFQYQSISNKNTQYKQIFLGLPVQIQLSLDHEQNVINLYQYAQVTQLEFNYPLKTQIISQYFDQYSHSLILDVEFQIVNGSAYKNIVEEAEPLETCGVSIELCQDGKQLQTIIEPVQQDVSLKTETIINYFDEKQVTEDINKENRSDDDILGLQKEENQIVINQAKEQKKNLFGQVSSTVTEEVSISDDLIKETFTGAPNFVCELFELIKVTLQVNTISFSTTNIQNSKFIVYNQYAYLHLQGVQSINSMQFEEQFIGYEVKDVEKQEWCKGNLLVFEFQCTYHNLKDFQINTEPNINLFSDISEQLELEERTFNPKETQKMNKFRKQSIFKSNLVQTTIKYQDAEGTTNKHEQTQGQLQLLSLIDKITKDKLYLVITAGLQKPSFCFNFKEQVLKVQLLDYSETLLSAQLTMEPYAHLYNGSLYPTSLLNVYNNLNKLVMRRAAPVSHGLVFLAQNETASTEPIGLQGPSLKQHFRDVVAELSLKDLITERDGPCITIRLGEKFKNIVQSFQPVLALNIELYGCCINGILNSVVTPSFTLELKVQDNYHVVFYLQFGGIDLIKEIVIEDSIQLIN